MYILAIDGGGTKTSAVICDEHGCIYAKVVTSRSNPTAMDAQSFESTIHDLLQQLQTQNPQVFAALHSCFAGMAGVKERQAEQKVKAIMRQYVDKTTAIVIENDACIALYAGTLGQEGIVQIAGTGAITMGYDSQQNYHRVGGWGYLFDDEGSGYDLGNQALKAVFQSYDRRAKPTALTDVILHHFSVEHVPQLIECIYGKDHPRTVIAPLSQYVFDVADKGDNVAVSIIEGACEKYYTAIKACYTRMIWGLKDVPVVLAGGVFTHEAYFMPRLQQLAKEDALPLRFMIPVLQPIGGAVVGAFKQMNVQLDSYFVEAFQKNYDQWRS
ncbi:N-acetylglucosamine kinase [Lysinibacillus sphaericus]|uniref:N-acetylglucosamine kinase n=1 Tax=Lysinibacillus sphaericus TaxID=1421 RepID=UPI001C5E6C4E